MPGFDSRLAARAASAAGLDKEGRHAEAERLAADTLRQEIARMVEMLGPERVQRGFARWAEHDAGPLPAAAFVDGDAANGTLARITLVCALDLLTPVIGHEASRALASQVSRLNAGVRRDDGSRLPASVLTADLPTHVQGDPLAKRRAVLAVRVAALIVQSTARTKSMKADERAKAKTALAALARIGVDHKGARSLLRVERALLAAAEQAVGEKMWEERRLDLGAEGEAVLRIVEAVAHDKPLSTEDKALLAMTSGVRETVDLLISRAEPQNWPELFGVIRLGFAR